MSERSKFLRWFIPAVVALAIGLAIAAPYDFEIITAVYDPDTPFGVFMECFGWYPAFIPPLMLAVLLLTKRGLAGARKWVQPALCAVVLLGGLFAIYLATKDYMVGRGVLDGLADPRRFLWVAVCAALVCAFAVWAWRMSPPLREKLTFFALWGSYYMIANEVVITAVKYVWQRTRFDEMLLYVSGAPNFDNYTPWYIPFANGGNSFPSGHTANAAGILALLFLCDLFPKLGRHRRLVTALCWVYIAGMAAGRVWIGRHFASDTLVAAFIVGMLFYALHHSRAYQKGLRDTLKKAALGGTAAKDGQPS